MDAGYARYEISNFSRIAKSSIHNRVYWEMENYLGLGLNASSFIRAGSPYFETFAKEFQLSLDCLGVRFTNTPYLPKYLQGERTNSESVEQMKKSETTSLVNQ